MNSYRNISTELRNVFTKDPVFKVLLTLDFVLLFGGLLFKLLHFIFNFSLSFGGLLNSLSYWAIILGLLLAYANLNQKYLYTGLFSYSAINLLYFIRMLFRIIFLNNYSWSFFNFSYIIGAAVYAAIGYLVFQQVVSNKVEIGRDTSQDIQQ